MSRLIVTVLSIATIIEITYVVFFLTDTINKVLGKRDSFIITRILAVLVAAIAVQYVVDGIKTM